MHAQLESEVCSAENKAVWDEPHLVHPGDAYRSYLDLVTSGVLPFAPNLEAPAGLANCKCRRGRFTAQ